jgi:hypothetical protein
MAYSKLDLFLAKQQTALGTKQDTLANTDYCAAMEGTALNYKHEMSPMPIVAGAFSQEPHVLGSSSFAPKIILPIIPTGGVTASNVDIFLVASGMAVATSTNKKTYTPSSAPATDWKDVTLWHYTGDKASGDSILSKAHSCLFDCRISGEVGKPCMAEFNGLGVPDGYPTAATIEAGAITWPASTVPAVLKATTITINDKTLKCLKFEVNMGNKIVLLKDATNAHGYSRADIGDRVSTWKATVYQSNANPDSLYPYLDAGTLGDFVFTFGTAGSRITIASGADHCMTTEVVDGESDGIKIYEVSGIFVHNDWSIAINDA